MPSNPKKGKTLKCTENLKEFYEKEDEFKFSEASSVKPEQQQIPAQVPLAKTKKRQPVTPAADFPDSDPEDDYDKGSDLEMQGMLNSFGADITKTITAKRKRIQTFTQASLKASSRKFDEVWQSQQHERTCTNNNRSSSSNSGLCRARDSKEFVSFTKIIQRTYKKCKEVTRVNKLVSRSNFGKRLTCCKRRSSVTRNIKTFQVSDGLFRVCWPKYSLKYNMYKMDVLNPEETVISLCITFRQPNKIILSMVYYVSYTV
ncbi:uncharacterized protein LOC110042852 isoform X1 [Orbicella faveolata]|uniref:uncharacterized protein LOC110042852 isoform X1 n=1 Tax=Orbicella faveolata TaxID=48498 RepID=UPI0009E380FE|nr:uncharacterized protein LOC110042852 isoform X1 [Orbicella faveolata]